MVACCGLYLGCGGARDEVTVQLGGPLTAEPIGVYVALAKGWYKDAGLKVKVMSYTDVDPDTAVVKGKADIGFSSPTSVIFSRAAGRDVVSVAAVLQRNVTELAVLDSSDVRRPRDLDGRLYASFGRLDEAPAIRTLIRGDGGKGEYRTAPLGTAGREALYDRRVDFTALSMTWDAIEAELRGIRLRTFRYDGYGVPDYPGVVLVASAASLTKRPAPLARFVAVTRRGYELAAQHPEDAARTLLEYRPLKGAFSEPEQVRRSAVRLAPFLLGADGHWGAQDAASWEAYSRWLVQQGIVTDGGNRVIRGDLPGGALFTNELTAKQ